MTDRPTPEARLLALQAARQAATTIPPPSPLAAPATKVASKPKSSGPAPGRIVAAAASVSAGIGLVALMAGAQQDVVVQVNPTPVTVQPASVIVEMVPAASPTAGQAQQVEVRVVEPAVPVERPVPQARVISQSEGS